MKIFGITMGDSSGVGPEILLRAWRAGELRHPVVAYGDLAVLEECNRRLDCGVPLRAVASPADWQQDTLGVIDAGLLRADEIAPGRISARSGAAARAYVVAATAAALAGEIAAMVTLPMNKEATQLSDPEFVGHTELIGSMCGAKDVTIMLVSDQLVVTHVSTHVSLAEAIRRVKQPRVRRIIELTCEARLPDETESADRGGGAESACGRERAVRAGGPGRDPAGGGMGAALRVCRWKARSRRIRCSIWRCGRDASTRLCACTTIRDMCR